MPIPPKTLQRLIRRDIKGKQGEERIAILTKYLDELPGYYQGDFGKLRKWIKTEIERAQTRQKVRNSGSSFFVPKEGDRQIALLGLPNAGKSSLLRALTGRQIKVGAYPFTTVKPIAGMLKTNGALLQLVEIPGIMEGAADGYAQGSALLAAARAADFIVWIVNGCSADLEISALLVETRKAGLDLPRAILVTHADAADIATTQSAALDNGLELPVVGCSTTTGTGLDQVMDTLWSVSGLIRVYLKRPDQEASSREPMVLPQGASVEDLARKIHKDLLHYFAGARVWGNSVKYPAQRVGLEHVLADEDTVEITTN